jgi:hypothetical protein
LTVLANGNVGIGISNPKTTLQLYESTYTKPLLVLDVNTINGNGMPSNIGQPIIQIGNSSWTNNNNVDYYGIGFGYVGDASVSVNKAPAEIGFKKTNNTGGTYGDIVISTRATLSSQDIASERMRITNTGNVGIGTTTPRFELHVRGSIYHDYITFIRGLTGLPMEQTTNFWVSPYSSATSSITSKGGTLYFWFADGSGDAGVWAYGTHIYSGSTNTLAKSGYINSVSISKSGNTLSATVNLGATPGPWSFVVYFIPLF